MIVLGEGRVASEVVGIVLVSSRITQLKISCKLANRHKVSESAYVCMCVCTHIILKYTKLGISNTSFFSRCLSVP